jgi:hypothetical protein
MKKQEVNKRMAEKEKSKKRALSCPTCGGRLCDADAGLAHLWGLQPASGVDDGKGKLKIYLKCRKCNDVVELAIDPQAIYETLHELKHAEPDMELCLTV